MNGLPQTATRRDLLKWVAANPNSPFDPNIVVSLSTGHTSDWEWQAVLGQLEDLRLQGYINRLKQDAGGSTYWAITATGEKYLQALDKFEQEQELARLHPEPITVKDGGIAVTFTGGWEHLRLLGEGGQSKVYLVRSPQRVKERKSAYEQILKSNPWAPYAGSNPNEPAERVDRVAANLRELTREDKVSEVGALKMFKIEKGGKEEGLALGRLRNEIAVLNEKRRPGLIELLEANEGERWIITQYMPNGALDRNPAIFRGDALGALRAFRSLVKTVAGLHNDKLVHRDIKPANVFLTESRELVLGDFGIVFIPDQNRERLTLTDERVGPRDYMPQWGDLGERLENVGTNFDVYMLGKLLWCMVTGKLKLPREYHNKPSFDVKLLFPNDPRVAAIDSIIKRCVVEEPEACLSSAAELLPIVDEHLEMLTRGIEDLVGGIPQSCRICGKGKYQKMELDPNVAGKPVVSWSMAGKPIEASMYVCDKCQHVLFFRAADTSSKVAGL
jgi:serine/threonine protein kinase